MFDIDQSVTVRYLDAPARTGTFEGTGHNYVTGTPNPDILRIRMDDPLSKGLPVEQFHRDFVHND